MVHKTHGESGLTERCLTSSVTLEEAELQTIALLKTMCQRRFLVWKHYREDKRFLVKYMPVLSDYFHYRSIDVSTIKELTRRWQPQLLDGFQKKGIHLALDDIRESIEELKYYRSTVFKI